MYLSHFGLSEPPFRITPHPEFFYEGASRGATLEALMYAVLHGEGIVKVTGEVGAGKTMLCRVLMEKLPDTVDTVYLANPSLKREELLQSVADELGVGSQGVHANALVRVLQSELVNRFAAGRQVVVLIDEAHAMPDESLEEIRLLSNLEHGHHKLMQLVLFGQTELDAKLAVTSMRQLRERITHAFELAPLRREDIQDYLQFRLRTAGYKGGVLFDASAVKRIAVESEGLTRRINILADKALLAAFAEQSAVVLARHADAAIADSGFRTRWWQKPTGRYGLLAAGIVFVVGVVVMSWWAMAPPATVAPKPIPVAAVVKPAVEPELNVPMVTPLRGADENLSRRLAAGKAILGRAQPELFAVQLMVGPRTESQGFEQFLIQAAKTIPEENLLLYPGYNKGLSYYGLLYGLFPDAASARKAMQQLPANLRTHKPLLRTVGGVRSEIGQSQN